MTNQTNGNRNSQNSWDQGRNDSQSGRGPANTNGWSSQTRETYDAGYRSNQNQSQTQNQNQTGSGRR
ncbi:MAG: hypothetical protein AB7K04_01880 [Pseudorhodoplanes sp.]